MKRSCLLQGEKLKKYANIISAYLAQGPINLKGVFMQEKEIIESEKVKADVPVSDKETPESSDAAGVTLSSEVFDELCAGLGINEKDPAELRRAIRQSRLRAVLEEKACNAEAKKRYNDLRREATELKSKIKDFDLKTELKDPRFKLFIRCGLSLEEAYKFTHYDEVINSARTEGETMGYEKAVSMLREGTLRPEENGIRNKGVISSKKNVESLTGGGIREILRRVEKGAKVKF